MQPAALPEIFLAFRFHVNFYHSYGGDSPNEKGFGKDILIITRILDALDYLSQAVTLDVVSAVILYYALYVVRNLSSTVFLGIFLVVQLVMYPIINGRKRRYGAYALSSA